MKQENHPRLLELFNTSEIYSINTEGMSLDMQSWGHDKTKEFESLIKQYNPKIIVEVGSWKGASAIKMGCIVRALGLNCKIICIDTWLGGLEHIGWAELKHKNGYPQLYRQFIFNVLHFGLQDIIIPFPQTSNIAARYLSKEGIKADMVYIDGSHDEEDVRQDIKNYYRIIRDGGVIFGDDYSWEGVKKAVDSFAGEDELSFLGEVDPFWVIKKGYSK